MLLIAHHAGGAEFDVDAFIAAHAIASEHVWRKGTPRGKGHMRETSGFTIGLPDAETTAQAASIIEAFLDHARMWRSALRARGMHEEFDLGMTVGSRASYVPSLNLPATLLATLGQAGIDLPVTGYPAGDEDTSP